MTRDPRTDPQPGDKRVYAYNPNAYDTVLSRTEDTVLVQATYANIRPSKPVCATITLDEWGLVRWPRSATYVAGLPCSTCAKSRSRATACGDVPVDPTACTRYYPRTGA